MTELTKEQLEAIERIKQNPDEFISCPKKKAIRGALSSSGEVEPLLIAICSKPKPRGS